MSLEMYSAKVIAKRGLKLQKITSITHNWEAEK